MKVLPALAALVLLASLGEALPQQALADGLKPVRILEARGFIDQDGKTAIDLSGIACLPAREGRRACVVINDEDRSAQAAVLEDTRLIGGKAIPIIGKKPSSSTLGEEPTEAQCSGGHAKFKDLDGEAVALAGSYLYVAGSHGCSRKTSKFRASSFIVARFRVGADGSTSEKPETSYRLAEVIRHAPTVGAFFGRDLTGANGLNVEGLAVVADRLIVGLRAPNVDGKAFLVSVAVDHLFSKAAVPPDAAIRAIGVPLGANVGVRDLASLGDGTLLVLAGPAQDQADVPYSVFMVDLRAPDSARHLATLEQIEEDGTVGKVEGLLVLDASPDSIRIVVIFDGLPNGGPREYLIHMR